MDVLGVGCNEPCHSTTDVVEPRSKECCGHLSRRTLSGSRHVAGTVRDCNCQSAPGFSAICLEHVLPHDLGFGNAAWFDCAVRNAVPAFLPVSSTNIDIRDEGNSASAGCLGSNMYQVPSADL